MDVTALASCTQNGRAPTMRIGKRAWLKSDIAEADSKLVTIYSTFVLLFEKSKMLCFTSFFGATNEYSSRLKFTIFNRIAPNPH